MEVDNEGSNHDPTVSTLLAMSEYYLSLTPQNVRESVRCLLGVLSLKPPPRIEARTRLKLGLLYYHHTNNLLEAREQLHQAALVTQSAANLEEIRFEATSVSTRILVEQRSLPQAKSLIRSKLDNSIRHPYWHMRLLLQLADIHVCERDERGVVSVLDRCVDYARQVDASYARLLCMLYKGAFLLTHHRYQEAGEVLSQTSSVIEGYRGDKENLIRTFYLVIQVSHLLMAGQVKTAKPHLKQLQQRVKLLSTETTSTGAESAADGNSGDGSRALTADSIQWLTREQTFVIVYLVSVMHSVMSGYTDKALSYADKAFQFMNVTPKSDSIGIVSVLRAHLLEHTIVCLLMQGKPNTVTDKLEEVITVCHNHPHLVFSHRAVLHTLLGLYAFATDRLDRAISQFHTALQHTNDNNLRLFITLNLAISYMKEGGGVGGGDQGRELAALMKTLEADLSPTSCLSLKAAVHYVKGLYSYTELKLHDAKRHLRETLVMSNKCDLNKLTACSLILLGQIFLSVGNTKETMDMVSPAMQLAQKIPERKLQAWAASLLADLYHLTGQRDKESAAREQRTEIEKTLKEDQTAADQSKHNTLLQWTVGDWPVAQQQPTSSLSTPSQAPPTTHHNMLNQHSSQQPSSSKRKAASSGYTPSSSSVTSNKKDGVESMEVDRPHPIAESATPTHMSATPTTHPSKGHKDRHPPNMYTTDAAGSRNDEMLNQQNGGPFATPNKKRSHGLKLARITPSNESPPRRHSLSSKSPEVRLTKLTSSPTGKLHPNQFSFNSEGPNRASNSQETKTHQLLQSQQGSQDPSQGGGGGGGEVNSLWMGGAGQSLSLSQTQGNGSNFLPSFDSDMAFRQLSLTPPSSSASTTFQQQQSQQFPTPMTQHQRHGQSEGHQGQRSLEQPQHQRQGGQSKGYQGQRSLEQPQQHHQLPGQGSHAQQQQQQGSQQYQQQSYRHQDVQQQGHQRESPLMRGAPPPYQPPATGGRSGDSSPTPSAFGAPLQHPMSNNPYNSSSSVRGHTTSPEKQRTQSPLAFSPHQQQQSMGMLYSSQGQQQGSQNVQQQQQQFRRHPQPQVQHGFINQVPPIPGPGPQPQQQQQHGSGSRTASPLHKQQQSAVERQSSGAPHLQQKQQRPSQVSGTNPPPSQQQQQKQQGSFAVERQASGSAVTPLQQQKPTMEQQQALSSDNISMFSPASSSSPGLNLPVQSQRATATETRHQQQQPPPQVNESLSIPTLHDLHNDLHQQQRLRSPLLGIPSFHQIQLNRGTGGGGGSNASSPQGTQGMMDMAVSNTNSPLLSSVQLQNPSPLHPGAGRSVSPHAHGSASARSGSPHTQHTTGAGGSPSNLLPLHQRLTPSQQQQSSQHHQPQASQPQQQQQVRTSNISPLHQQARHVSPIQQPSPQSMIQQHSLQTHSRSPHQQEIQMPQLHQLAQHSSPKRHQQLPQVNLQGPQVQSQNQNAMSDGSSMLNLGGHFLSQPQPQHLGGGGSGSQQKIQLYPMASEQQQQQATAILQQQQQQLIQLQQAQAQAQRQFILQQQQQRQRQRSPPYMQGSSSAQAFFPVAGRSSPTTAAAMLNTAASTNKQLGHPQLTHLSVLQNLGHDGSLRSGAPSGGTNLLNQQPMLMGSNPYATSFGQGLPLLPNGTAGVPGAGAGGVAGFQQPGQSMGSPLRHFYSQGR